MKKLLSSLMLIFVFILSAATLYTNESKPDKLVINYYRYDENYADFNIWLWEFKPNDSEGIEHAFKTTDVGEHGVFMEIDLNETYPGATTLGLIIKKGAWGGYQEVGGNRYIDLSKAQIKDGVASAYFVEQEIEFGISDDDLTNNIPDYRDKILTASFQKANTIDVTFSSIPIKYEILENNVSIWESVTPKKSDTITLSENIDMLNTYEVVAYFEDDHSITRMISLEKLYDTKEFIDAYTYEGDLGVILKPNQTTFRLWAPISNNVTLNLYNQGHELYNNLGGSNEEKLPYETYDLTRIENGAWEIVIPKNLSGKYYTFTVTNGNVANEVVDPYAYSTGANGLRGLIVDFANTNPQNWTYNNRPNTIKNLTDYLVYELHVRDLTAHESWNGIEENRGKFLGLTESNTTYTKSGKTISTGLDHIVELGVNAVQLLPIFDFGYINETEAFHNPLYPDIFNWGYMPYNFNTLEGSYSTNPFDGFTRINEFKQVVQNFHNNDIRVIMDVVYNHTGESASSNFHKIVPGYYHRLNNDGSFSNGSGTGNEMASERQMMRKFMVESVVFWATEYNLSGFRFDLMKLHDVETMLQIEEALHKIDPTIVIYGEPWTGGDTPLPANEQAGKVKLRDIGTVGAFNDDTRDAIKGSVFQAKEGGFVQGNVNNDIINKIKYGISGGINHPEVNHNAWHTQPYKTINYVEAHDNNTLHDKLRLTGVTTSMVGNLSIQANAMILTAQGIPFIHAGAEFLRSKPAVNGTIDNPYDHNSYESPDSVNQMRWDLKHKNIDVFEYYKTLISIRKNYSHFRLNSAQEVLDRLSFLDTSSQHTIAFKITGDDTSGDIIVIHSGHNLDGYGYVSLTPGKNYKMLTSFEQHNINGIEDIKDTAFVTNNSTMILVEDVPSNNTIKQTTVSVEKNGTFDPLANLNYDALLYNKVTTSNYFDLNKPGYYTITVRLETLDNKVSLLRYTLRVTGNKFKVTLKGGQ